MKKAFCEQCMHFRSHENRYEFGANIVECVVNEAKEIVKDYPLSQHTMRAFDDPLKKNANNDCKDFSAASRVRKFFRPFFPV